MIEKLYPINNLFVYRFIFMAWLILGEALFLYKFERKKKFGLRLFFVLLACFTFALIFPIPTPNPFYSMFMFFFMFLFTYGAGFFLFRTNWKILLFAMICGYTCEHIAYETYYCIVNLAGLNENGFGGMYDYNSIVLFSGWLDELIYFSSYIIVYYLIFLAFGIRLNKNEVYESKFNYKFLIIGIIFIVTDIVMNSVVSWYSTIHFENVYVGIAALINVVSCLIGLFYIFEMFYSNSIKNQMKIIEELQKEEISQYKISKDTIDLINIKCHDFRHQIREFGIHQQIDGETIENLNKLIRVYDSTYHTANEALNVILSEKSLLCNSKNIRFSCIVDGEAIGFIRNEDIYSLFGNIIDNAIEAVEELEESEKIISLKIKKVGNMVSISEKNGYRGTIQMENGLPVSKKNDQVHHGFGVKSIKMICDKYKGSFQFSADNNVFTMTILFIVKDNADSSGGGHKLCE